MSGVDSLSQLGSIDACSARTAWSGEVHRQAIVRLATFAASIWSGGEYFALA
jgi:hypothetical protein